MDGSVNAPHTTRMHGTAPPSIKLLPPPPPFLTGPSSSAHIGATGQPGQNRTATVTERSTCKQHNALNITPVQEYRRRIVRNHADTRLSVLRLQIYIPSRPATRRQNCTQQSQTVDSWTFTYDFMKQAHPKINFG